MVVTDYVGLGATDRLHAYVNRLDGGHALLDAVRATRALPTASITEQSRVGLYGYSQGGGASAAAAGLQPSYAPELTLSGTYAGRSARRPDRSHQGHRRQRPRRCAGLVAQRLPPVRPGSQLDPALRGRVWR
ncbi:hypothetical protein GCM10023335_42410 [Streptomyces siamensis]|uniref:Uncharacterized protein n=1 Tax=Streptomyces siamensis TaxID=1274986 RepID=A0ABP9J0R9_9ACTN